MEQRKGVIGDTEVSIRAPAWGAIGDDLSRLHAGAVSIRAPAWGAIGVHVK